MAQAGAFRDTALQREIDGVIDNIDKDGPFPYKKDGEIFHNRERLLPQKPRGYYRAYTVPTPGVTNRGRRRLVVGRGREVYYTPNHYQSFVRIA